MRAAVTECRLDLQGATVLTEAASGPYVVTPVLAALAGASVVAVGRSSDYGTYSDIRAATVALAAAAGVAHRVLVLDAKRDEDLARADIVTNSGHLRPLDEVSISRMQRSAVISLMYEAWELASRPSDVAVAAARRRGIAVAGTNERHPAVDVFSYLGPMAVKALFDAGVAVYRSSVVLLCDNDFSPFLEHGLTAAGASVTCAQSLPIPDGGAEPDAVVVALRPAAAPVLTERQVGWLCRTWPSTAVVQFWGDLERERLTRAGIPVWPTKAPRRGHMGVLPSDLGPEPVVRLQAGGLKVGEVLWRSDGATAYDREFVDAL